jgi:hypothetical protein
MKRFGVQNQIRFDEKELKTNLGNNNFIFVGSSNDMFADGVMGEWIYRTLNHCKSYPNNSYLFQSKNTYNFTKYFDAMPKETVLCTTIETNRVYKDFMRNSKSPQDRAAGFRSITNFKKFVTIEPIMDFDLKEMIELIKMCNPEQVNIGADSNWNNGITPSLPEPSKEKLTALICELMEFTDIHRKKNLNRLLK